MLNVLNINLGGSNYGRSTLSLVVIKYLFYKTLYFIKLLVISLHN